MPFPVKDQKEAAKFLIEFMFRLGQIEDIKKGWEALKLLVHINVPDLNFSLVLDARGEGLTGYVGAPKEEPDAVISATPDDFHELYTGKLSVPVAFSRKIISMEGKTQGIVRLTRTMPAAIAAYKEFLAKKGFNEDGAPLNGPGATG